MAWPRRVSLSRAALLALVLVGVLALAFVLVSRSLQGETPLGAAVSTDPIALYVVENGKVEERRSGVGPAWSPDGRRLAYKGDFDGRIWVDDRPFLLDVGIGGEVQWTPDGRSLLFEGNGIRLLDLRTGVDRLVAPGTAPALSPDGETVAYLRYRRTKRTGQLVGSRLQLVPLTGGTPRIVARTRGPEYGPHFESRPQWLPDGTAVVIARRVAEREVWAIELVRLDGRRRVLAPRASPDLTLSRDGRSLVYLRGHTMVVAKRGGREEIYPLRGLIPKRYSAVVEYDGFSWSPDGREVAFSVGGADLASPTSDMLLRVYALDVATGKIRRLAEIHDASGAQLAWNPRSASVSGA